MQAPRPEAGNISVNTLRTQGVRMAHAIGEGKAGYRKGLDVALAWGLGCIMTRRWPRQRLSPQDTTHATGKAGQGAGKMLIVADLP